MHNLTAVSNQALRSPLWPRTRSFRPYSMSARCPTHRTGKQDGLRGRVVADLCTRLLAAPGGPASALAFETLVWLHEQASLDDAPPETDATGTEFRLEHSATDVSEETVSTLGRTAALSPESFAAAMAHRFPTCTTAWAVLGLMIARRSAAGGKGGAGKAVQEKKGAVSAGLAMLLLEHGLMDRGSIGGGPAAAWTALAQLRLAAGDWQAALAAVTGGMAWVRRRRDGGYGTYASCVLALRTAAAEAHLLLGQPDEADLALQKLAGSLSRLKGGAS